MKLVIIGAGGHGQVVAAALAAGFEVLGFLDDDRSLFGRKFLGMSVLGPIAAAHDMDASCVVAIGDNRCAGEVQRLSLKAERARHELGGRPSVSLEDGLAQTLALVETSVHLGKSG